MAAGAAAVHRADPRHDESHRLEENLGAAATELSPAELEAIAQAAAEIPIVGERYAPQMMAAVGREAPPA